MPAERRDSAMVELAYHPDREVPALAADDGVELLDRRHMTSFAQEAAPCTAVVGMRLPAGLRRHTPLAESARPERRQVAAPPIPGFTDERSSEPTRRSAAGP